MAKSHLEVIFEFTDINQEHIDFVKKTLYKYKDDQVVNLLCNFLNENAVQSNRLIELFTEADSNFWNSNIPAVYPLIIPSPNFPTELRVFPNIILDQHSGLDSINTTFCSSHLKTFLKGYDEDITDEKRKQKWAPLERAEKKLLEYVDMPTARALGRYVFNENTSIKDHQVRNFGEAIDSCRKPMKLIFTEKPEDYTVMYGSGPHSCMAFNAGERINWEFMKDVGVCPTSWYHYSDLFTGVYALKAGKVVARTILFKAPSDKNWGWIRIYSSNDEVRTKFTQSLAEQGITQSVKPVIPEGHTINVPGIKKGSVWAAPWPYIDSPIPAPHTTGQTWNVQFDKKTHEFIFHFNNKKYDAVNGRSGHIISSDYSTMECTCCGKVIKKNEVLNIRIEDDYHVFCSDSCAALEGFVKVMEGTGNTVYKKDSEDLIPIAGRSMYRFSTKKAAHDSGFHPVVSEPGVFAEDWDQKMSNTGFTIRDALGNTHIVPMSGFELSKELQTSSKIPFRILEAKKLVIYDEDKVFVAA